MDFYRKFYVHRKELRKKNTIDNKRLDILFAGKLQVRRRVVADYTDERYKYPIYRSQIHDLRHEPPAEVSREQTEVPGYPQRPWFLAKLRERFHVLHTEGIPAEDLADVYLQSKINFQPHGVGPRHSIYECMMLGIPSIIPECSYLDTLTRKHNFICSELMHWIPVEDIQNLLDSPDAYRRARDEMIDDFESNMTHTAIIDKVFGNIEKMI